MAHIWNQDELEATKISSLTYAVRPIGQLGSMGWSPRPWTTVFVTAGNSEKAIKKALRFINNRRLS